MKSRVASGSTTGWAQIAYPLKRHGLPRPGVVFRRRRSHRGECEVRAHQAHRDATRPAPSSAAAPVPVTRLPGGQLTALVLASVAFSVAVGVDPRPLRNAKTDVTASSST